MRDYAAVCWVCCPAICQPPNNVLRLKGAPIYGADRLEEIRAAVAAVMVPGVPFFATYCATEDGEIMPGPVLSWDGFDSCGLGAADGIQAGLERMAEIRAGLDRVLSLQTFTITH